MNDAPAPTSDRLETRTEGGVRWLTLNRPRQRNALDGALVKELANALREVEVDAAIRVVVVTGAGDDFCAGADLREIQQSASASVLENLESAEALGDLFLGIRRLRVPVVAAVRGRALAGGCGLALACDLVLAEDSARFGFPEVAIGFVPAMVMAILRRSVGEKRAFDLVATGRSINAAEAERFGLINRVFADELFDREVQASVAEMSGRSSSALQLAKRLLYGQDGMGYETGIRAGAAVNVLARATHDARAGIDRFLNARIGDPR